MTTKNLDSNAAEEINQDLNLSWNCQILFVNSSMNKVYSELFIRRYILCQIA